MFDPPHDLTRPPDLRHKPAHGPTRTRRPVYQDLVPPCSHACPAGEHPQAWLALAQAGRHREAWERLVEDNPFPVIHGRVCYHPCEPACNREQLDGAVAIHAVESYLGDAAPVPGGMMHVGIPAYRLPRPVLEAEAARIEALGARFELSHVVRDLEHEWREGGFDAVFVAVGAHLSKRVEIPARDAGRMLDAVSYLRDVDAGVAPRLGRRVAIYGGGNTAMDAAGCGETPYLKLLSQLFGDRMLVANATGCSSIYGGNLPTTPWSVGADGRGPAWSNSLFEDNAEFGLGMRLAADHQLETARRLVAALTPRIGDELADELLAAPQRSEYEIRAQRARVDVLLARLAGDDDPQAQAPRSVAAHLVRRSVWIVGSDGWAYDIGSGGLDHVLASGRNVNVLVLDTEVYSNTGGQASKATPLGAVAKFASAGKRTEKKDLALQAISYGNVYVARIAVGANPQQTLQALREAEAYDGPSPVLAYSHCIAHGIEMDQGLDPQARAVHSGHWPLVRYNPRLRDGGESPFTLDSVRPTIKLRDYAERELRYRMLMVSRPAEAEQLMCEAQAAVDRRWKVNQDLAASR